MTKTLYILLIAAVFGLVSCADETPQHPTTKHRINFSLTLVDGETSTRALPGDPGVTDAFVKPSYLYTIVVMTYDDGTYVTYSRHDNTAVDNRNWSDLAIGIDPSTGGTEQHLSKYQGTVTISSPVANIPIGTQCRFYAFASTEDISSSLKASLETQLGLTALSQTLTPGTSTKITSKTYEEVISAIKAVTFDLPPGDASAHNTFLRSAYNTPADGYTIDNLDVDDADKAANTNNHTVTATLYHTATRLDIQWDYTGGDKRTALTVNNLPTTAIHAFTPSGNVNFTNPYNAAVTLTPGNEFIGREVFYVPSLDAYNLTNNSETSNKGSNLTNGLIHAPWVRINLK